MHLDWDYDKRTVTISMPGYIEKMLKRFQHQNSNRPEHSPHRAQDRQIGVKIQLTEPIDESPLLEKAEKTNIQRILGTLLDYSCAVDPTLAVVSRAHFTLVDADRPHLLVLETLE